MNAEEVEVVTGNKCGDCKWWRALPRNPMNLAGPAQGQCHGNPPQMLVLDINRGQANFHVTYPTLPAMFPGCRLFGAGDCP